MSVPSLLRAGQDRGVLVEREGSLLASFCADREKGSEAVSPVAIVWPCPLAVDAYAAAGRDVGFPRPACPSCAGPLVFWSGYWRYAREAGRCRKIFVPRLRCARCGVSHALLPAFTLAWRLDVAETVGRVLAEVAGGGCGVRPAAERAGVPYTTARGGGPVRAGGDRRRVRRGRRPAGMGPAGGVAVRVVGDRREADRRQHSLALVRGRQAAFDGSCPAMTAEGRTAWITSSKSRSRCTGGR